MERRKFIGLGTIGTLIGTSLIEESFGQSNGENGRAITNKMKRKPIKPLYVPTDNSPFFGGRTKIKFEQTNNQFTTMEFIIPPKTMGPAPHVHKDLDETMRVLKGTVTVMVGDKIIEITEGGWHIRPHGITHTFWNATNEPVHFVEFYANQNFDIFFEDYGNLFKKLKEEGISADSTEGRKRQDKIMAEWGIQMYHNQKQALIDKYGLNVVEARK